LRRGLPPASPMGFEVALDNASDGSRLLMQGGERT